MATTTVLAGCGAFTGFAVHDVAAHAMFGIKILMLCLAKCLCATIRLSAEEKNI